MKHKMLTYWMACAFTVLIVFQLITTNVTEAYQFNAFQLDQQIRRMNMYPPALAKLGYILEAKKEVQIVKRLESNFFSVIDFGDYFPGRFPYFVAPFFFLGLFVAVGHKGARRNMIYAFLVSIVVLTLLGPYALHGPVLLIPFIMYFALTGLVKAVSLLKQ